MVLYEETYEIEDTTDYTIIEKYFIGLGGTTTVRLNNGTSIDLVETGINYYTGVLVGRNLEDIKLGFEPHHIKQDIIPLTDICEVITEGFIITSENRDTIIKLMKEVKFTKIAQRD